MIKETYIELTTDQLIAILERETGETIKRIDFEDNKPVRLIIDKTDNENK